MSGPREILPVARGARAAHTCTAVVPPRTVIRLQRASKECPRPGATRRPAAPPRKPWFPRGPRSGKYSHGRARGALGFPDRSSRRSARGRGERGARLPLLAGLAAVGFPRRRRVHGGVGVHRHEPVVARACAARPHPHRRVLGPAVPAPGPCARADGHRRVRAVALPRADIGRVVGPRPGALGDAVRHQLEADRVGRVVRRRDRCSLPVRTPLVARGRGAVLSDLARGAGRVARDQPQARVAGRRGHRDGRSRVGGLDGVSLQPRAGSTAALLRHRHAGPGVPDRRARRVGRPLRRGAEQGVAARSGPGCLRGVARRDADRRTRVPVPRRVRTRGDQRGVVRAGDDARRSARPGARPAGPARARARLLWRLPVALAGGHSAHSRSRRRQRVHVARAAARVHRGRDRVLVADHRASAHDRASPPHRDRSACRRRSSTRRRNRAPRIPQHGSTRSRRRRLSARRASRFPRKGPR